MQIFITVTYQVQHADRYPSLEVKQELLTLDTVVPVTHEMMTVPILGGWSSPSKYLGRESAGKYYLKNLHLSDEERWALIENIPGTTREDTHPNPIGFFFDSTKADGPFLVLEGFNPMKMEFQHGLGTMQMHHDQVLPDASWQLRRDPVYKK